MVEPNGWCVGGLRYRSIFFRWENKKKHTHNKQNIIWKHQTISIPLVIGKYSVSHWLTVYYSHIGQTLDEYQTNTACGREGEYNNNVFFAKCNWLLEIPLQIWMLWLVWFCVLVQFESMLHVLWRLWSLVELIHFVAPTLNGIRFYFCPRLSKFYYITNRFVVSFRYTHTQRRPYFPSHVHGTSRTHPHIIMVLYIYTSHRWYFPCTQTHYIIRLTWLYLVFKFAFASRGYFLVFFFLVVLHKAYVFAALNSDRVNHAWISRKQINLVYNNVQFISLCHIKW